MLSIHSLLRLLSRSNESHHQACGAVQSVYEDSSC